MRDWRWLGGVDFNSSTVSTATAWLKPHRRQATKRRAFRAEILVMTMVEPFQLLVIKLFNLAPEVQWIVAGGEAKRDHRTARLYSLRAPEGALDQAR